MLLLVGLLLSLPPGGDCIQQQQQQQYEHDSMDEDEDDFFLLDGALPTILDRADIAYFYQQGLDELADIMQFIFERSSRIPRDDDDDDDGGGVPDRLLARGSGFAFTTRTKLLHDLEQAMYLGSSGGGDGDGSLPLLVDETERAFFEEIAVPIYTAAIESIPESTPDNEIHFFSAAAAEIQEGEGKEEQQQQYLQFLQNIDLIYNKAWRPTFLEGDVDEITGELKPLLTSGTHQPRTYTPGEILVLDNFLTDTALKQMQQIMTQSTVWFEASMESINGGDYVTAASLDDGLSDKILLQLVYEIESALQLSLPTDDDDDLVLHDLWARKYKDGFAPKIAADVPVEGSNEEPAFQHVKYLNPGDLNSDIRVHLWLSSPPPTAQNDEDKSEDSTSSNDDDGLIIFHAQPPADFDFTSISSMDQVVETILRPSGFANTTVAHVLNRAVIFDAKLFHTRHDTSTSAAVNDDDDETRPSYPDSYRTELTILYGPPQAALSEEEGGGMGDILQRDEL